MRLHFYPISQKGDISQKDFSSLDEKNQIRLSRLFNLVNKKIPNILEL